MDNLNRTLIGAALVGLLGALFIFRNRDETVDPHSDPGAVKPLSQMEGVIDHSRVTDDPVLSDLYVRAAKALEKGDAKGAERIYREAIAKYPNDPAGHSALGTSLFFQNKLDPAIEAYEQALKLDARSNSALFGLGCVAYKQEHPVKAMAYLNRALAVDEGQGGTHRLMGLIYRNLGDRDQAIRHFERAIELASTLGSVDDVKSWLAELKQENEN